MNRTLMVNILCTILLTTIESFILHTSSQKASSLHAFEGTVVVCTGPTCSQKGSKTTLEYIKDLAPENVQVETITCVSECAECALGPNVEMRATGKKGPFFPIKNKVTTEEDVRKILELE